MGLFRLKYLTWREFGRRIVKEFQEDTVTDCAAQLSYYFLFSLFPLLFFLVTLAAYLPFAHGAVESMMERVAPLVPGDAMALVNEHLRLAGEPAAAQAAHGGSRGGAVVGLARGGCAAQGAQPRLRRARVPARLEDAGRWPC